MPKWQRFRPGSEARGEAAEAIAGAISSIPAVQSASVAVESALDNVRQAVTPMVQQVSEALEPAQQIVAGAKTLMSDPLRYLSRAASKAIPAAIAASASLQYTGGLGSFENFLSPLYLRMKFFQVDGDRAAFVGRPCCKTARLSTLTGFALCENVKLDLPGTSTEPPATLEEQQTVCRYLEAGVYIE